jgi:hypothetical protein
MTSVVAAAGPSCGKLKEGTAARDSGGYQLKLREEHEPRTHL